MPQETSIPLVVGDGLHAWEIYGKNDDPAIVELGRPAASEIEARSADWPVHHLERPGWRLLETPLGEIRGDPPLPVLGRIGTYLEEFEEMLRDSMAGPAPRSMYRIRIFSHRKDFCAFAACIGAANAQSLYDPRTGEIALWADEADVSVSSFESIFAHELVHAYMDLVWNRTAPLWFAEGMAEYHASFRWQGDRPVPGQVKEDLLGLARRERLPLATLVRLTREEMYGPEWPRYYALAWSVVHYLERRLPDLSRRLLAGERNIPEPEELDLDWWSHLLAL